MEFMDSTSLHCTKSPTHFQVYMQQRKNIITSKNPNWVRSINKPWIHGALPTGSGLLNPNEPIWGETLLTRFRVLQGKPGFKLGGQLGSQSINIKVNEESGSQEQQADGSWLNKPEHMAGSGEVLAGAASTVSHWKPSCRGIRTETIRNLHCVEELGFLVFSWLICNLESAHMLVMLSSFFSL